MKSVKRSEISEEVRYVVDCPHCGDITDIDDDSGHAWCEHCNEGFDIEEDD